MSDERLAELEAENDDLRRQLAAEREFKARCRLSEVMAKYDYDATGQDGEREIEAAAQDLVDTQDANLRMTDPIGWAEKRAFYGCG